MRAGTGRRLGASRLPRRTGPGSAGWGPARGGPPCGGIRRGEGRGRGEGSRARGGRGGPACLSSAGLGGPGGGGSRLARPGGSARAASRAVSVRPCARGVRGGGARGRGEEGRGSASESGARPPGLPPRRPMGGRRHPGHRGRARLRGRRGGEGGRTAPPPRRERRPAARATAPAGGGSARAARARSLLPPSSGRARAHCGARGGGARGRSYRAPRSRGRAALPRTPDRARELLAVTESGALGLHSERSVEVRRETGHLSEVFEEKRSSAVLFEGAEQLFPVSAALPALWTPLSPLSRRRWGCARCSALRGRPAAGSRPALPAACPPAPRSLFHRALS